jgi:proteasome lid subunit RPN8/RPN11
VRIAAELLEQIVEHARRDTSEECCGVVATRDGVAVAVYELENTVHSKRAFNIGADLVAAAMEIEDAGNEIGGLYHSHVMSEPVPSQTDMNFSVGWPGVEWIIVGLKDDEPEVRSWLVDEKSYTEVPLEIT